jgi:predicted TIM-barrel fold metal-dependent hydrolase
MAKVLSADEFIAREVARQGRATTVTFIDPPEPEPLFCPIISVDDHAMEPPNLFQDRLPASLRDRGPRVETTDDGLPWWIVDDARLPIIMTNAAAGRPKSEWGTVGVAYEDMWPGVYDSRARLADLDAAGTWATLCFGSTLWGFAGGRFADMADPALGLASLQAYNDWMIDEWCAADPDRYIPCQLPWLRDPVQAAEEIRRNADRGFRAVSFSENPEGLGYPNVYDQVWEPFFRACEETGTVINLHVGSSGSVPQPCSSSHVEVNAALFPVSGIEAIVDWIYAGIPTKYPDLQIVMSEAGVSWVPMVLERLQRSYRNQIAGPWPGGDLTPRELVQRNFFFTSIEDPSGFRQLDIIGEDNVMVESDYPHFDTTWPQVQSMIRYQLEHLPHDTVRKVCFENAARVYRWSNPPEEWVARSDSARRALTA